MCKGGGTRVTRARRETLFHFGPCMHDWIQVGGGGSMSPLWAPRSWTHASTLARLDARGRGHRRSTCPRTWGRQWTPMDLLHKSSQAHTGPLFNQVQHTSATLSSRSAWTSRGRLRFLPDSHAWGYSHERHTHRWPSEWLEGFHTWTDPVGSRISAPKPRCAFALDSYSHWPIISEKNWTKFHINFYERNEFQPPETLKVNCEKIQDDLDPRRGGGRNRGM